MNRNRFIAVIIIAIVSVAASVAYVVHARRKAEAVARSTPDVVPDAVKIRELRQQSHALIRTTRHGEAYGRVAIASPQAIGQRYLTDLDCDRLASVASVGVCLTADRGVVTTYQALVFGEDLTPRLRIPIDGIPSRVRLSPNGAFAGITVFVSGHGYSDSSFSTKTILVDTRTGEVIADLESFAVTHNGKKFSDVNFNFWGVTFTKDSNVFYATLGSGKQVFLIRGDVGARRATVVREGIECPALSPDNTRLAFKKRIGSDAMAWRLAVLDLESGREQLVEGETRNVDDQVEWLDDRHILYMLTDEKIGGGVTDLWSADVNGGPATLWAAGAESPAIISHPQ